MITSKLYEAFIKNVNKNPEKIFFYDLKKKISGSQCLLKINKILKYIKKNKIIHVAINCNNSIDWALWYIAAKKDCKRIFIFNQNIGKEKIKEISKKYSIDLIVQNFNKLKLNKNTKKNISNKHIEDILFTSGTTNFPKGVIINENAYIHVAKILIKKFKQDKNDLELLSMPFNHSFGLCRLRCNIISGSSSLITNGLKDFPSIYNFSKNINITGLSLVPTGIELMRTLLKNNKKNFIGNLKFLEIGSSFLSKNSRIWLKNNFKNVLIYHHYGTTEASRSFLIRRGKFDNIKIKKNYIGYPIKGCKIKIDKKNMGELLLKGKNLFSGYLEEHDNKNKILNGWFKTGDLCINYNKKIKLIGRIDNQINIGGIKVQPEIIEDKVEKITEVKKCLCFSVNDNFFGKRIALIIEKNSNKISNLLIEKKISIIFKNNQSYLNPKFIFFKKIKITKNGKKIRKLLII